MFEGRFILMVKVTRKDKFYNYYNETSSLWTTGLIPEIMMHIPNPVANNNSLSNWAIYQEKVRCHLSICGATLDLNCREKGPRVKKSRQICVNYIEGLLPGTTCIQNCYGRILL
jgi:hypothetical protein